MDATGALPHVIETPRLILRRIEAADAEALGRIGTDAEVTEHLLRRPRTTEEFEPIFRHMLAQAEGLGMWSVVLRSEGRVVGRCGFYPFGAERVPELAYLLARGCWGRGLATEMAAACLECGLEMAGWPRIIALTRASNQRSIRVLEKIGMVQRGSVELADLGARAELFERVRPFEREGA